MPIYAPDQQRVDQFFTKIEPLADAYREHPTFSYVAVKNDNNEGRFEIWQGRVVLNPVVSQNEFKSFESDSVRAGHYPLSTLGLDAKEIVRRLLEGQLETPQGVLHFPGHGNNSHMPHYTEFHDEGLRQQTRLGILALRGSAQQHRTTTAIDWQLKAASVPYDSLQELLTDYALDSLRDGDVIVDVVAATVAVIDARSRVSGTQADIYVRLATTLEPEKFTLGYRVMDKGRVIQRASLTGRQMTWSSDEDPRIGKISIDVPSAAVVNCVASYAGFAQHHYWIIDPTTSQNPARAIYENLDGNLEKLKETLASLVARNNVRLLERMTAWLLVMLGFRILHFGEGSGWTEDFADIIAFSPNGNCAVIECTTGRFPSDKLSKLIYRTELVRERLRQSGNSYVQVLSVILTIKTRMEIRADLRAAEELGIFVMTKENFDNMVNYRTMLMPNAEGIFNEAMNEAQARQAAWTLDDQIGEQDGE